MFLKSYVVLERSEKILCFDLSESLGTLLEYLSTCWLCSLELRMRTTGTASLIRIFGNLVGIFVQLVHLLTLFLGIEDADNWHGKPDQNLWEPCLSTGPTCTLVDFVPRNWGCGQLARQASGPEGRCHCWSPEQSYHTEDQRLVPQDADLHRTQSGHLQHQAGLTPRLQDGTEGELI